MASKTREPEAITAYTNTRLPETQSQADARKDVYAQLEEQAKKVHSGLANYVTSCFEKAQKFREASGVDRRIIRALRRRKREYDPEDADLVANTSDIYIPIIDLKCRAGVAWMTDILTNSDEQPWTLSPTPNPSIPENIKQIAIDALKNELLAKGINDVSQIAALAKEYKSLAHSFVTERAQQACARMEILIRDTLLEGMWIEEFRKFLDDLTTYPTAFFEFPLLRYKKTLVWKNDALVEEEKLVRECARVDPVDVFPSEDSIDTQTGSYYIIRRRLTYNFLYSCIGLKESGFNEENIRIILDRFKDQGTRKDLQNDSEEDTLKERQGTLQTDNGLIDALCYYGAILGEYLIEIGILVDDPSKPYEAFVWVVDDLPIYAVLNPLPMGHRPLMGTSFKKINGSFYGEALPDLLESIERMANAAARALARNMAYASGPFGEYDINRMSEEETEISYLEPLRLYATENNMGSNTNSPAIHIHSVDSHANELQAITENYLKLADDVSGIPAYVLGNPQVAGAGRTMGGLSMLIGNAAKGIKHTLSNADTDVIAPTVRAEYNIQMKHGTDTAAKVDAQVIARGSTGVMQRELAQTRTTELLQVLTPFMQFIPPSGIQNLLREVLKTRGYNIDSIIPNPQAGREFGGIPITVSQPSSAPGIPQPALDGRSAPPAMPWQNTQLPPNTAGG